MGSERRGLRAAAPFGPPVLWRSSHSFVFHRVFFPSFFPHSRRVQKRSVCSRFGIYPACLIMYLFFDVKLILAVTTIKHDLFFLLPDDSGIRHAWNVRKDVLGLGVGWNSEVGIADTNGNDDVRADLLPKKTPPRKSGWSPRILSSASRFKSTWPLIVSTVNKVYSVCI